MVGDVKQSIYRFRQAKPEIFLEKYATYGIEKGEKNRKIMLYKNFRSRKEVIDSCNYVFENIMSKNIGEIEYTKDEALNLGASFKENLEEKVIVGGPTEIHLMEKAQKTIEESQNDEEQPEEELDNIQLEARMVGKIIKNLMAPDEKGNTYKVYDKKLDDYRVVDFKDIVILLRATSAWAPVFADELINMGIPTYADTGMGYFDTIEIKTVMSFLRIIDNPMQDIPLLSVLKSPILPCTSFTPEDFIDIRLENNNTNLYECMRLISESEDEEKKEIREKCRNFLKDLKEYKEKSLYMSTDEFLWHLYMKSGYYAYVGALPSGSQRQANLKILFERAKQFEETSFKGIFNFINFIDKIKKSNSDMGSAKTLGENANVVRIMSIHKSKGLEFPIVFCSAMSKNFNTMDFKKDMLYHYELGFGPQLVDIDRRISYPSIAKEALKYKMNLENLSEEMRILYVALTRAKEKLILTGSVKDIPGTLYKWGKNLDGDSPVSQYDVLKAKNYLDWIMPSVLKHKDFNEIRKAYNIEALSQSNHDSKWSFDTWERDDVIVEEKEEETNIESLLKEMEEKSNESDYSLQIYEKLNYVYPYEESVKVSASISVSEIKKIQSVHEEDYSKPMYEEKITFCSAMSKNFNTMDFKKDMLYHYELGFGPQLVDIDRRISYPSIAKEALKYKMNLENLSEEMRILYVALTRAKEKLILTGSVKDIPGTLYKWGKNLDGDSPVSQYDVLKAKNYLDWIMPSVLKHKDFNEIRKAYNIEALSQSNHDSKWSFDTWERDDVIVEEKEEETNIESLLKEMEEKSNESDYSLQIYEKLNYVYPYEESVKVSASISVSEIKKIQSVHEEDYSKPMYEEKITLKRPLFIQEDEAKNKISPQERGTIVHLVMEVIDLNKINTLDEIKSQIKDLIKKEIISEKQSLVINPFKIYKFFKSNIGKRALSSHFIKREQSIYSQIKMNDIYLNNEDIQNNRETYEEESLMLRGIIDLYFEEDDEIVIVDYKTDYIDEDNKQEVIDRYRKQLDLYAEALNKLTGKRVKEKYLYLFNIDEEVKL